MKELLELAAKACGIDGYFASDDQNERDEYWSPLTDDGDCARMEARLGIDVIWDYHSVVVEAPGMSLFEDYADHNGDKQAARRMASLRAAAEIGRGMSK